MLSPNILAGLNLFRNTTSSIIFFVCIVVSSGILLYYANRHPHPKFRPKLGELLLVGMIFFGGSVLLTATTAGLFDQENLDEGAKKIRDRAKPSASSGGGGDEQDVGSGGGKDAADTIFKEELPPFVPEEE